LTHGPIEFPAEGLVDDAIRLRLRVDADIPAMVKACQDEAIQRYTVVPANYSEANAREFGRRTALALADGTALSLVIADADTDNLLGTVALRRVGTEGERWSVGYWVAPWARQRGVATAAVRIITAFGFDELGARQIELLAEPENAASVGVAERAGFRREGLLRDNIVIKGVAHDVFMYTLLPPAPG
jgi:RimJ/RimL family protein N-acetyltransferase